MEGLRWSMWTKHDILWGFLWVLGAFVTAIVLGTGGGLLVIAFLTIIFAGH
jgi:hypothetical protein